MLRLIIIALLIWGGYYVVTSLNSRYQTIEKKETVANQPAPVPSASLEGMPYQLQGSLDAAEAQGPAALKRWIDANQRYLRDPKLGDIPPGETRAARGWLWFYEGDDVRSELARLRREFLNVPVVPDVKKLAPVPVFSM